MSFNKESKMNLSPWLLADDWRLAITEQLAHRKRTEQLPFENIFQFTNGMFDKVDLLKAENFKLCLENNTVQDKIKETALQIEHKELKEKFKSLDEAHKTLNDEYIALSLIHQSLESKHLALQKESEKLKFQILEIKKQDAERLNEENERALLKKQEKIEKDIERKLQDANNAESMRIASGDPAALAIAAMAAQDMVCSESDELARDYTPTSIPSKVLVQFDAHDGDCDAICWYTRRATSDNLLATGGSDRKIKLWKIDGDSAKCIYQLYGSNASITSIDVENDVLLASSNDMASRIWSLNDNKLKRTLTGHSARVYAAKFLYVSNKIASGSNDRTVKIWDINRNACTRTYFAGSTCHDLVNRDQVIISGHFDKKLRFWDIRMSNQEPIEEVMLPAKITSVDITPDGQTLLASLRDDTIKVIDLYSKQVLNTISADGFHLAGDTCRARFSRDGSLISCGSLDGSMYIWRAENAKLERVLKAENSGAALIACYWCPERRRLVSIERSRKVTIWH